MFFAHNTPVPRSFLKIRAPGHGALGNFGHFCGILTPKKSFFRPSKRQDRFRLNFWQERNFWQKYPPNWGRSISSPSFVVFRPIFRFLGLWNDLKKLRAGCREGVNNDELFCRKGHWHLSFFLNLADVTYFFRKLFSPNIFWAKNKISSKLLPLFYEKKHRKYVSHKPN